MLKLRLVSGLVLGLGGIGIVVLDCFLEQADLYYKCLGWRPRGLLVCLTAAALAIVAIREFYALARAAGLRPFRLIGAVVSTYLILETCGQGMPWGSQLWPKLDRIDFTMFIIAAGLSAAFMLQVARWGTKGAFGNIGVTLLGAIYVGLLGSFVVRIRQIGWVLPEAYSPATGAWCLAVFVGTIKVTDICAYFAGNYLGRRKLIPSISPGKTVEGLIAGLTGGIITCVILCLLGNILNSWLVAALLGLVLAGLGQLGDLAESIFKRDAHEKDSSDSVPGFGGLLDVIDSILVPAPLAYMILAALTFR